MIARKHSFRSLWERLEDRRLLSGVSFDSPVPLVTAGVGSTAASADLNRDGRSDLVVVNSNSNSISVFLNKGTGTFAAARNFTTGAHPGDVVVADFNGDKLLDIAVSQVEDGSGGVFLGFGDGTFSARQDFDYDATQPAGTDAVDRMVAGDFNGDRRTDLVVADKTTGKIITMLSTSSGLSAVSSANVFQPRAIVAGDFNRDGVLDVAVLSGSTAAVQVFFGLGNGHFSAPTPVEFASASEAAGGGLVAADFNKDGLADLAADSAGAAGPAIDVLLGKGDGTFRAAVGSVIPAGAGSMVGGDFDGDGKSDLLINFANSTSDIVTGIGTGAFAPALGLNLPTGLWSKSATADFSGDGKLDFAAPTGVGTTSAGTINVFRNSTGEIVKAVTTTTVASALNPANFGDAVQFTITVGSAAGVPSGKVSLFNGSKKLATLTLDVSGAALFTTSALTPGAHALTAKYLGTVAFAVSASAELSQSVVTTPTNIVATVTSIKLPSIVVPGDKGSIKLLLQNLGGTIGQGLLGVKLVASLDGTISDDDILLTSAQLNQFSVNLSAGKKKTVAGTFSIPSNITPGNYTILATLVAGAGLSLSDVSDATLTATTAQAALSFGTLAERRGVRLIKTLGDGTVVTFRLSGPGAGTISKNEDGSVDIDLIGATTASTLTITAKGGAGTTNVRNLTTDAALGGISAGKINFTGSLHIAGAARKLSLGNVSGALLTIDGLGAVNLTAGTIAETSIQSNAPFSSIKVASWTDVDSTADVITAPWIGTISSKAGLPVDLNLSGSGAPGGTALKSFSALSIGNADWTIGGGIGNTSIKGALDGTFAAVVSGNWNTLSVGGAVAGFSAAVSGLLRTLTVAGDFTGDLAAGSVGAIAIKGDMIHSRLLAGAGIKSARFGGLSDDSRVLAETLPGKVKVAGVSIVPAGDPRFHW